jgi:UDP-N-acetylmuramyl pentapeptide phosphotransferase/UDP-N-acetylglucosamine-1-phosphate transferase
MHLLLISLGVFLLSYLMVMLIRSWMVRHKRLVIPNERSNHVVPTPTGGGLAIVISTLAGSALFLWIAHLRPLNGSLNLILAAMLLAGISLWDDLHPLPYWPRIVMQLAVAGMVILGVGTFRTLQIPFVGQVNLGWAGLPLTFLWIVGMINAYNFMDGIDDIAVAQAVASGLGLAGLGWLGGQFSLAGIALILAASSLGLLVRNSVGARIFMGDVGSAFLGFAFAVLPLIAAQSDARFSLAGVLVLWPFLFDTLLTFFRRLLNNENVFKAHRTHVYQRLVSTGFTHKRTTLLYVSLSIIGLVYAAALFIGSNWADYLLIIIIVLSVILWQGTRLRERSVPKVTTPEKFPVRRY